MASFKNISKTDLHFSLNPQGDFIIPVGTECELPEDNAHVKTLEASGYLTKIKSINNPKKPKDQ
jgi:hypothetical protein